MSFRPPLFCLFAGLAALAATAPASAQLEQSFFTALEHPAIHYDSPDTGDVVTQVNARLADGRIAIMGDDAPSLVRSVLRAFDIPVESQILVFSRTSLQATRISRLTPRTLFFNDRVAVSWVQSGFVEVATQSPRHGAVFYSLAQSADGGPRFVRRAECLRCHHSYATGGIPGLLNRSVFTGQDGYPLRELGESFINDRTPFEERWGGRYVTGTHGTMRHRGNGVVSDPAHPEASVGPSTLNQASVGHIVKPGATLTPYSDLVALLVFDHQMHTLNLLTRIGWEARVAAHDGLAPTVPLEEMASEVADALLFVGEAPLPAPIRGTSGFAAHFEARGPRDSLGRSLRQFDLRHRLMKFPCSYLVYSEAFDALPVEVQHAIYGRMWEILSGQARDPKYASLSRDDRQAIIEILRETKADLPDEFM